MEKQGDLIYERFNWEFANNTPLNYFKLGYGPVCSVQIDTRLYSFKNLEEITFYAIRDFDPIIDLSMFEKLKAINFYNCSYDFIDSIFVFAKKCKIEKISFRFQSIPEFPDGFLKIETLKELEFIFCIINTIPTNFSNLDKLEKLSLEYSFIRRIDSSAFLGLANLERINFINTPVFLNISFDNFYNLIAPCKSLKSITLGNTGLTKFPYEFGNFPMLEELGISEVNIKAFDSKRIGLCKLKILNLTGSSIYEVSGCYKDIPELYLGK